jgi:hypothetical protein
VAVNVVEVVPAGTMTELEPGSSSLLLLDSKTSVPPAGAAPFNVTVQVVDASEFNLFVLHANRDTKMTCPKAAIEGKKATIPMIATLNLRRRKLPVPAAILPGEFPAVEGFSVATRRIAFHAAEPHEGEKGLWLEPPLVALGLENLHEVINLACAHSAGEDS